MNKASLLTLLLGAFLVLFSCSKDDDDNKKQIIPADKTVLIYASAENDLDDQGFLYSSSIGDIPDILNGKASVGHNNLLIYVDRNLPDTPPYILRITPNGQEIVKNYTEDFYSSAPSKITEVVKWVTENYPAPSYGLVLWGHGSGYLAENDTIAYSEPSGVNARKRAYGVDFGTNHVEADGKHHGQKWINVPTLAKALHDGMPTINDKKQKFDFILFDCCNMQTVEVAYEMRDIADYIIGSPAEIPGYGAPYATIIKDFYLPKEYIGKGIVNDYIDGNLGNFNSKGVAGVPMSCIKTSELDNLAYATASALSKIEMKNNEVNTVNCIYYLRKTDKKSGNIHCTMYDMRNVIRKNLANDAEELEKWETAFNKAVFYRSPSADRLQRYVNTWETIYPIRFDDFTLTDDTYGGVSMFFPKERYNYIRDHLNPNETIFTYDWTHIVNWHQYGW